MSIRKRATGVQMDIGEALASQRRQLGLAIEDIAATTGMSPRQVVAIEALSMGPVPTADMQRMLRLYARKVGLAAEIEQCIDGKVRSAEPPPATEATIPRFLLKQAAPADVLRERRQNIE